MALVGDQTSGTVSFLPSAAHTPILALPDELLSLIFDFLWVCGPCQVLLPASSACERFRRAAAPRLFSCTVSCALRDPGHDRLHRSFETLVGHPNLLRHVRTLCVRVPLAAAEDQESGPAQLLADRWSHAVTDLDIIKRALQSMQRLHTIRYCGSLASCLDILALVRDRPLHVILEAVFVPENQAALYTSRTEASRSLSRALIGREISWGYLSRSALPLTVPLRVFGHEIYSPVKGFTALRVSCPAAWSDSAQFLDPSLPLSKVSTLQELVLYADRDYADSHAAWTGLRQAFPWSQLSRLCIQDNFLIERLRRFNLPLTRLRCLRILLDRSAGTWAKFVFHPGCQYIRHVDPGPRDVDYFAIDFACLPALTELEIEGICNHVPIPNLVSPTLRALRLHAHHYDALTLGPQSQRSPADLAWIAQIAPDMERLELDIGDITNLWHSTSIPGVDVDVELYTFLTTLARFKHLHTLGLFPHYVEKSLCARLMDPNPTRDARIRFPYKQAIADVDAVAMFERLRSQIPVLEHFYILPSEFDFWTEMTDTVDAETDFGMRPIRYQPMSWHMTRWGDKTILVTRQARKNYMQRQIWVGQRRLTTSIQRDKYVVFDNSAASAASSRMAVNDGWILD